MAGLFEDLRSAGDWTLDLCVARQPVNMCDGQHHYKVFVNHAEQCC